MKREKQIFADAVRDCLSGDALENALDFVAFLRDNKMNPANTSKNGWKLSSKACVICYIWLDPEANTLTINPFIGEYSANSLPDDMKEICWAKKTPGASCGACHVISGDGYNCSYKIDTVFGKEYTDACARSILFKHPTLAEFECIKNLLVLRKNTIKNGTKLPNAPTNYM